MGGAPVVEMVRPGVRFTSAAAASFRRLEGRLGRRVDVNSTYRDYDTQLRMYNAWTAYVQGRGPHPGHSRALHPDNSIHCRGMALDSDDWRTPGFIDLAAEYGWIRTAANDPTEQHHFEYQQWRDQHRNEPALAGEEEDMTPEQSRKLDALYDAMFNGGPSMGDRGRSVSYSLGNITNFLDRIDKNVAPVLRAGELVSLRQEVADAKTNTMALLGRPVAEVNVEISPSELVEALTPLLAANQDVFLAAVRSLPAEMVAALKEAL